MLRSFLRVHSVKWFCIHAASIWTWTGSTTTGHGQLCHSAPLKLPRGATGVLGFSDYPTSSGRKASYWPGFLLGHHAWHRSSSVHDGPKPPLSHLLWLQLKGPFSFKAIHQLQQLLIHSNWWVYLHWSLVRLLKIYLAARGTPAQVTDSVLSPHCEEFVLHISQSFGKMKAVRLYCSMCLTGLSNLDLLREATSCSLL